MIWNKKKLDSLFEQMTEAGLTAKGKRDYRDLLKPENVETLNDFLRTVDGMGFVVHLDETGLHELVTLTPGSAAILANKKQIDAILGAETEDDGLEHEEDDSVPHTSGKFPQPTMP